MQPTTSNPRILTTLLIPTPPPTPLSPKLRRLHPTHLIEPLSPIAALSLPNPLPLIHEHEDLGADILDDVVHVDVDLVAAEGVLELGGDAVDAVEGEGDEGGDGDGPPAHVVDHGEGEDHAEEGEDLFLVDSRGGRGEGLVGLGEERGFLWGRE